jgi:lauroyl/myristoyl acyltransferase
MPDSLRALRRNATQLAIGQTITATSALPIGPQRAVVSSMTSFAGSIPFLSRKVRENMRLALGHDVPAQTERLYFRQVGWVLSNSLIAFHHGIAATQAPEAVKFDGSVHLLDEAVAEGRGVVLAAPHWCAHEIAAAIINCRNPMAMLVREGSSSDRTARKVKWYNALGVETVLRPSRASAIKDAVAYLNVLKRGKLLAVTLDHLAAPGQGIETRIFGRAASLQGGAFALAISAKAPMIRVSTQWQPDASLLLVFDRAPLTLDTSDRYAAMRDGVQDWCLWFEEKLRANPENWLFWLDRRWSHFFRATPRTAFAE